LGIFVARVLLILSYSRLSLDSSKRWLGRNLRLFFLFEFRLKSDPSFFLLPKLTARWLLFRLIRVYVRTWAEVGIKDHVVIVLGDVTFQSVVFSEEAD
jgi:hypothetical protein